MSDDLRELSDKMAEVEFKYSKLLKAYNRLKLKHKNLEYQNEHLVREFWFKTDHKKSATEIRIELSIKEIV